MEVLYSVWRGWCKGLEPPPDTALNRLRVLAELLKERGSDVSVLEELCQKAQDRLARHSCVAKLSPVELDFKKHVERGHIPWRNDCRACVYGVSHSRPCRKRKYPHMYTLSLDVTGPFKPGVDVTGAAKYALVGVYTFPRFWRHGVPLESASGAPPMEGSDAHVSGPPPGECLDAHVSDPPPGECLDAHVSDPLLGECSDAHVSDPPPGECRGDRVSDPLPGKFSLPPESGEAVDHAIPEDFQFDDELAAAGVGDLDDLGNRDPDPKELDFAEKAERKWQAMTKASLEPLAAVHLPFVIPLFKKGRKSILQGIQQIYLELKRSGYPVFRMHTDRGREFLNSHVRTWSLARDIVHTSTPADRPAGNGLCERFIGLLKGQARALLYHAGLDVELWPMALRYAACARMYEALKLLGETPPKLWPFGAKVVVQERSWHRKSWRPRSIDARVLCPAPGVTKAWLVLVERKAGEKALLITTLCYTKVKDPEMPELIHEAPEHAYPTRVDPNSVASGEKPLLPAVPERPPLSVPSHVVEPAVSHRDPSSFPIPSVRLREKTALRVVDTQGGVLQFILEDLPRKSNTCGSDAFGSSFGVWVKAVEVEGCLPELSQVWFAERLDVKGAKLLPNVVDDLEAQAVQVSKRQTLSRDEINRILSGCKWVKRGKRAVEENGQGVMATFGAFTHGGVHGITRITYRCPELVRLLN